MSKKNKDNQSSSGSSLLAGLIGAGIGLFAGFLATKLLTDDDKISQPTQVPAPIPVQSYENATNRDQKFQEMMLCPITQQLMNEPMTISQCGHTFQKKTLCEFLAGKSECPLCRVMTTSSSLVPNYQLKSVIDHYKQTRK